MLLDPSHPAPIWVSWPNLSLLERLSFLTLCILSVYSLFLAATVLRLLNTTSDQENRERISKRVRNLRQATIAAFYFFGFVLFGSLQFAYFIIDSSSIPLGFLVIRNFQVHFAFADNAFLVLLSLHFIQWFVSNRVAALASQSKP